MAKGTTVASSGRPPATTHSDLARVAVQLFAQRGFDETTVDDIVEAAGVGRRTFFRYFATKSSVLWNDFDEHVQEMTAVLAATSDDVPMMTAIRHAVVTVNSYGPADLPDLRLRTAMIGSVPALQASATLHYARWEQVVADFVAARTGLPGDSLLPRTVGRCVLAACRSAFEEWAMQGSGLLGGYLTATLRSLEHGFPQDRVRVDGRRLATRDRAAARRSVNDRA